MISRTALVAVTLAIGCAAPPPSPEPVREPDPPPVRVASPPPARVPLLADIAAAHRARIAAHRKALPYLKGSTHVHTLYSGDSRTRPRRVVKWYADAGYDFIVITDHNRVTDATSASLSSEALVVIAGIELTNNPPSCEPPPPEPRGKCRIHVNSLFVTDYPANTSMTRPEKIDWRERKSIARTALYQAAIDKSKKLGGLTQLNHPTWHRGVDEALMAELGKRGVHMIEIANVAFERWNRGTESFPSTEAIWDAALSAGHPVWGVASDDAHHYYDIERRKAEGGSLYPAGGGFVMVRASKNPTSIRLAMARGDFYSSTGLLLRHIEVVEGTGSHGSLVIEAAPTRRQRSLLVEFITAGGKVVQRATATSAVFPLASVAGSYVRARVSAGDGSVAWTQPVFVPATPSPRAADEP